MEYYGIHELLKNKKIILILGPCSLIPTVKGISRELFKTGVLFLNRQVWMIAMEIRQPKGAIRAHFKPRNCRILRGKTQKWRI